MIEKRSAKASLSLFINNIQKIAKSNPNKTVLSLLFVFLILNSVFKYFTLEQGCLSNYMNSKKQLLSYPILQISLFVILAIFCFCMKNEKQFSDTAFDMFFMAIKILVLLIFFELGFENCEYGNVTNASQLIFEGFKFCFIESVLSPCIRSISFRILSDWMMVSYFVLRQIKGISTESWIFLPLLLFWTLIQILQSEMDNFSKQKNEDQKDSDFLELDKRYCHDGKFINTMFRNYSKKTNDALFLFDSKKRLVFVNLAGRKQFSSCKEEELEKIMNKLLNLEIIISTSKINPLVEDGLEISTAKDQSHKILKDKNLSELSSVLSFVEKSSTLSSLVDKILTNDCFSKDKKRKKKSAMPTFYKFFMSLKNINEGSGIFYQKKKKGFCNIILFRNKPFVSVLIKSSQNQKSNANGIGNLSKTLVYFADEIRVSLNIANILHQSLEKMLDFTKNLNILKPLDIAMKLMICLQEEMIYLKQILDMKSESGVQVEFNLQSFLTEIASLFSFQSDRRGVDLQIIYDKRLAHKIFSDPNKIKIILVNLLKNALRSTFKDKIIIKAESESISSIKLSVIDNGAGLTPIEKEHYREILYNKNFYKFTKNSPSFGLILSNQLAKTLSSSKNPQGIEFISSTKNGNDFFFFIEDKSFRCQLDEISENEEELSVNYNKLMQTTQDKKFMSFERDASTKASTLLQKHSTKKKFFNEIEFHDSIAESTYKFVGTNTNLSIKMSPTIKGKKTIDRKSLNAEYCEIKCSLSNLFESDLSTINCSKLGSELYWGSCSDQNMFKSLGSAKLKDFDCENAFKKENKCHCCQVLVVDDDELSNHAMNISLKQYGLKIECTSDHKKALEIIKKDSMHCACEGVQLVFIGIRKTRQIAEKYKEILDFNKQNHSKPPLIAVIGRFSIEKTEKIKKLGFDDFLSKPIFQNFVFGNLEKYLKF